MRVRRLASALWCDGRLCRGIFTFCTLPPAFAWLSFWPSNLALVSDVPAVSGDGELLRDRECECVKHNGDRLRPRLDVAGLVVTTPEDPPDPAADGTSNRSSRNEKSVYRSQSDGRSEAAVPRSNCDMCESVEKPFVENSLCSRSSNVCSWCEVKLREPADGRRLPGWLSDIHFLASVFAPISYQKQQTNLTWWVKHCDVTVMWLQATIPIPKGHLSQP